MNTAACFDHTTKTTLHYTTLQQQMFHISRNCYKVKLYIFAFVVLSFFFLWKTQSSACGKCIKIFATNLQATHTSMHFSFTLCVISLYFGEGAIFIALPLPYLFMKQPQKAPLMDVEQSRSLNCLVGSCKSDQSEILLFL